MPEHFYVYPAYLSGPTSRREGRRVPGPSALEAVTAEEIATAARRLGYTAEIEAGKLYARQTHAVAGRVKVTKQGGTKKAVFLRAVVDEIRRARPVGGKVA